MVYRNNADRLGAGFISVCLETRWLGQNCGFYELEPPCIGILKSISIQISSRTRHRAPSATLRAFSPLVSKVLRRGPLRPQFCVIFPPVCRSDPSKLRSDASPGWGRLRPTPGRPQPVRALLSPPLSMRLSVFVAFG